MSKRFNMFNISNFKKFAASPDWIKNQLTESITNQADQTNIDEKDTTVNSSNYDANITSEDRESGEYDSLMDNNKDFLKNILSDYGKKNNVLEDLNKKVSILESQGQKGKANALRTAIGRSSDPKFTEDIDRFSKDIANQL